MNIENDVLNEQTSFIKFTHNRYIYVGTAQIVTKLTEGFFSCSCSLSNKELPYKLAFLVTFSPRIAYEVEENME